jgi:hypothetical protein
LRELRELHASLPEIKSLEKLLSKLSPEAGPKVAPEDGPAPSSSGEAIIAEEELDFSEVDLVSEDLEKNHH